MDTSSPETNRDRVRRLLLTPLGFRFDKTSREGKDPIKARDYLNRICDDLSYLSDHELRLMREMMQAKGDGTKRCFWPCFASFRGHAESIHRRPIEDLPEIRSWFGSVEGPRAREAGTLVETYDFLTKHKRPPYLPKEQAEIRRIAEENAAEMRRIARARADGVFDPGRFARDRQRAEFEQFYTARRAFVDEIVAMVQEKAETRAQGRITADQTPQHGADA